MANVDGTSGNDFLIGTTGDEIINGYDGNDTIAATQGHDTVDGGTGSDQFNIRMGFGDRFSAATGARTYTITAAHAGDSSATLNSDFGNIERVWLDTVGTGNFNDTIDASGFVSGNNGFGALRLTLGNGNNTVTGSAMSDWITTGIGSNSINAGSGYDEVYINFSNAAGSTITVTGSGGTVLTSLNGVFNSIANAELVGLIGSIANAETITINASALTGFNGQLVFYDNNGSNIDVGSAGSDIFANVTGAVLGNDIYTGNGGADVYDYTYAVDAMNGDTITDFDSDDVIDLRFNNLEANGSPLLCNHFIGAAAFNGIAGEYRYYASGGQTFVEIDTNGDGVGDHSLNISNGAYELVETASGSNILKMGRPIINGTNNGDFLIGTAGDDVINGLDGNDTVAGTQGQDSVDGGTGFDQFNIRMGFGDRFSAATGARMYTVTANHVGDSGGTLNSDLSNIERVWLDTVGTGNFNDTIDASGFVSGNTGFGALRLTLGNGNNTVTGSAMSDWITTGIGSNSINAGSGYDEVYVKFSNAAGSTITVTGSGGTVLTSIDGVTNSIINAELVGLVGSIANAETTTINASGLTGFNGQLVFWDNNGSNIAIGSSGSDIFANVTGAVLGHDVYTGNGGADVYDYTYAVDAMNGDTITDFDADDVIDLRFNDAVNNGGLIADRFIGFAVFSGVAGEYRYVNVGGQTLVQADTNGDGVADQTLTLNGTYFLKETTPGSNLLQMIQPVYGDNLPNTLTGTADWDVLIGNGGNDIFYATKGRDLIIGGNGNDRLVVTMGNAAQFAAATGPRTYNLYETVVFDTSLTLLTALNSVERVSLSTLGTGDFGDTIVINATPTSRLSTLTLGAGDDNVIGSAANDRIELNAGLGANTLDAGGGVDDIRLLFDNNSGATNFLTGSGGTVISSFGGGVTSITNAEIISIQGTNFNAAITRVDASGVTGFAGTLIFYDQNGSNISIGSGGADLFANVNGGELGDDVYTGNGGADIYDYTYAIGAMDRDLITDFDGDDIIDLQFNDPTNNGSGLLANHFIGSAAFSGVAGEYRTQIVGATTILEADTNGDGVADETLSINGNFQLGETVAGSNQLHLVVQNLAGTVADGYVSGATIFVDVNGNHLLDAGEANTVTGPGGNYTLNTLQVGTLVAIGGTNVDTGLANTMTLVAPAGSGVVNPLTTLIAAVIAASNGNTSAAAAEAAVKQALGLSAGLDLLHLDLLGQGSDPAALAAQKAAAMIANLVATAEGTQGAGTGAEAALVGALAGIVSGGSPVDLTDSATLTDLLTQALPGVANIGAIATAAASDAQAIAAAASIAGISAAQLAGLLTGDALDNDLAGNGDANLLLGMGGNDHLVGLGGDDTLNGGSGDDRMEGGLGNDIYMVDGAGDRVTELFDQGIDEVRSSVSYTLGAHVENLEMTGAAVSGTGNELDNFILGNGISNRLSGGEGNDRLQGGDGVDFLTGGSGNDRFIAEINATKVGSKDGPISLDVITDFARGDKIDLSGIDANSLASGFQSFSFKGSDANKLPGGVSFKVYDSMAGAEKALGMEIDGVAGKSPYSGPVTMVFGNIDGGSHDFALALINTNGVSATDFLF